MAIDQPPRQPQYSEVRSPTAQEQEKLFKEKERRRKEEEESRRRAIEADLRSKTKDTSQKK